MLLDQESAKLITINTHQGLYKYTKLPFGVSSALAIFQHAMDAIPVGLLQAIYDSLITAMRSAGLGRGYWSTIRCGLIVTLYSPQSRTVLFFWVARTMGAAQSACSTLRSMPDSSKRSRSLPTSSLMEKGTD